VQGFADFIKSIGATRLGAMVAVTLALIGFFGFIILRVTSPHMTPLYTDLTVEDSNAIIKDLDRQGIAYEIKNEGAVILVPKDKVTRLRMKLAEGGLPKGGGVGYEIFDKSDALGATSFVQNINHLRALEGELSRTIRALAPRHSGAATVLARQGRTLGFDRAQGERRARTAAGQCHQASHSLRRHRPEAGACLDRR
jgi:flagellar M-ring protein FliF